MKDMLELYYYATIDGNQSDIERCLRDLAEIGVDKYIADIFIEEMF